MTKTEKETFLILRGWKRNSDKLLSINMSLEYDSDGKFLGVNFTDEKEHPNKTWDKAGIHKHKTLDEALLLEGIE